MESLRDPNMEQSHDYYRDHLRVLQDIDQYYVATGNVADPEMRVNRVNASKRWLTGLIIDEMNEQGHFKESVDAKDVLAFTALEKDSMKQDYHNYYKGENPFDDLIDKHPEVFGQFTVEDVQSFTTGGLTPDRFTPDQWRVISNMTPGLRRSLGEYGKGAGIATALNEKQDIVADFIHADWQSFGLNHKDQNGVSWMTYSREDLRDVMKIRQEFYCQLPIAQEGLGLNSDVIHKMKKNFFVSPLNELKEGKPVSYEGRSIEDFDNVSFQQPSRRAYLRLMEIAADEKTIARRKEISDQFKIPEEEWDVIHQAGGLKWYKDSNDDGWQSYWKEYDEFPYLVRKEMGEEYFLNFQRPEYKQACDELQKKMVNDSMDRFIAKHKELQANPFSHFTEYDRDDVRTPQYLGGAADVPYNNKKDIYLDHLQIAKVLNDHAWTPNGTGNREAFDKMLVQFEGAAVQLQKTQETLTALRQPEDLLMSTRRNKIQEFINGGVSFSLVYRDIYNKRASKKGVGKLDQTHPELSAKSLEEISPYKFEFDARGNWQGYAVKNGDLVANPRYLGDTEAAKRLASISKTLSQNVPSKMMDRNHHVELSLDSKILLAKDQFFQDHDFDASELGHHVKTAGDLYRWNGSIQDISDTVIKEHMAAMIEGDNRVYLDESGKPYEKYLDMNNVKDPFGERSATNGVWGDFAAAPRAYEKWFGVRNGGGDNAGNYFYAQLDPDNPGLYSDIRINMHHATNDVANQAVFVRKDAKGKWQQVDASDLKRSDRFAGFKLGTKSLSDLSIEQQYCLEKYAKIYGESPAGLLSKLTDQNHYKVDQRTARLVARDPALMQMSEEMYKVQQAGPMLKMLKDGLHTLRYDRLNPEEEAKLSPAQQQARIKWQQAPSEERGRRFFEIVAGVRGVDETKEAYSTTTKGLVTTMVRHLQYKAKRNKKLTAAEMGFVKAAEDYVRDQYLFHFKERVGVREFDKVKNLEKSLQRVSDIKAGEQGALKMSEEEMFQEESRALRAQLTALARS